MTDELERLRIQLRDTRKKPVAGDFWQAVEQYEAAVRRDERAQYDQMRVGHEHIWVSPTSTNGLLYRSCGRCGEQYDLRAARAERDGHANS